MGFSSKSQVGVDKVPYSNAVRDRRLTSQRSGWRLPRSTYMLVPTALVFAIGGFCFTCWWNNKRAKEGPCVDCKRQQEIMEEMYFRKPTVQKGYRF